VRALGGHDTGPKFLEQIKLKFLHDRGLARALERVGVVGVVVLFEGLELADDIVLKLFTFDVVSPGEVVQFVLDRSVAGAGAAFGSEHAVDDGRDFGDALCVGGVVGFGVCELAGGGKEVRFDPLGSDDLAGLDELERMRVDGELCVGNAEAMAVEALCLHEAVHVLN
jgi:hypothetical protein